MNNQSHSNALIKAIEILKNDHFDTYHYLANSFASDLLKGNDYADRAGVPQDITIDLRSIWTVGESVHTWRIDLSNTASFTHYYDPDTNQGLNLSAYENLERLVEAGGVLTAIVVGAAGFWVDVAAHPPLNFDLPYQSAADACQEHYDNAVDIWRNQRGSYPMADAMFHLGWASHFFGDLSVSAHTTSSRFLDHQAYEDKIDQVLLQGNVRHIQNISSNLAQYNLAVPVRNMAANCATETSRELDLYDQQQWNEAAMRAIPRSESYTARLLAKFFQEVGVERWPLPLLVQVKTSDGYPIPFSVVFYRRQGKAWRPLVTDAQGTTHIVPEANEQLEFRPASPGYFFKGKYHGDAVPEFHPPISPVPYQHNPDSIHQPSITFRLASQFQFPVVVMLDPRLQVQGTAAGRPHIVRTIYQVAERTSVEAAIAEMVDLELMGDRPDTEPNLVVDSPTPAHIRVRVYSIANVLTGQFIRSRADLENLIQAVGDPRQRTAEFCRRRGASRRAAEDPIQPEAEVREALSRTYQRADELHERVYAGHNLRLKAQNLAAIPSIFLLSPGRHHIQVEVMAEPGFVGYGFPDQVAIESQTNAYEEAWFRILAGSQAGRLKLKVSVSPLEGTNVNFGVTTKIAELWVMPSDAGGYDADPPHPPQLERV